MISSKHPNYGNDNTEPLQDCILLDEENDEIRRSSCMGANIPNSFNMDCNTTIEDFELHMRTEDVDPYMPKARRDNNSVFLFGAKLHAAKIAANAQKNLVQSTGYSSIVSSKAPLIIPQSINKGIAGIGFGNRIGGVTNYNANPLNKTSAADKMLNTSTNNRKLSYQSIVHSLSTSENRTEKADKVVPKMVSVGSSGMIINREKLLQNAKSVALVQSNIAQLNDSKSSTVTPSLSLSSIPRTINRSTLNGSINSSLSIGHQVQHGRDSQEQITKKQKLNPPSAAVTNKYIVKENEINALLSRTSSHNTEAESIWFDEFASKMKKHEAHEYMVKKVNEETVNGITLRGYQCSTCNYILEHNLNGSSKAKYDYCVLNKHAIQVITVLKHYFECVHCLRKTTTVTPVAKQSQSSSSTTGNGTNLRMFVKPPVINCEYCKKCNWKACGKKGSYITGGAVGTVQKEADSIETKVTSIVGNGISGKAEINYFDK